MCSFRLCELLYEKRRQFAKVLSCYIRDNNRRVSTCSAGACALFLSLCVCVPFLQQQCFSYVRAVMNEDLYTEPDREEVARAVLQNFKVHALLINVSILYTLARAALDG